MKVAVVNYRVGRLPRLPNQSRQLMPWTRLATEGHHCCSRPTGPCLSLQGVRLPIPTFDQLMLPVLRHCAEQTWSMRELIARIAEDLQLTEAEREQEIPSGDTRLIASRVHWAKTYLKQAGLLEQPKRGIVKITERGRDVLKAHPSGFGLQVLHQFPEFLAFLGRTKPAATLAGAATGPSHPLPDSLPSSTPEEQLETASGALNETLRDALLARILEASPASFEKLIIDLLLKMGYGGSRVDAGEQLGRTGDGGVDGIIREDRLGLDRVYLQAKRYKPGNAVGSEAVQAFIGALVGRGSQKGVLISTSAFTKNAIEAAKQSGALRLVLIDGATLTNLMIQFNVGVRIARMIDIKRIDLDYFEEIETE